jgi:hypothetical protein
VIFGRYSRARQAAARMLDLIDRLAAGHDPVACTCRMPMPSRIGECQRCFRRCLR